VKEADFDAVKTGMPVRIDEETYHIQDISQQPVLVEDTFVEYLQHVGGLAEGEWVYIVTLDGTYGDDGMITEAKIVIESIAPMRFVMN
jgi:hypothetical protein